MPTFKIFGPKGGVAAPHAPAKRLGKTVAKLLKRYKRVTVKPNVERKAKAAPRRPITMYDSVNVAEIPYGAEAVAGYVNGHWPTYGSLAKRFPKAHRLSIAVTASADAECLDIERGDASPDQAPAWVKRQHYRGVKRPVVYSSLSEIGNVLHALAAHGIGRSQVRVWTAHYTHKPHRCSSACGFGFQGVADATQYDNRALGRNLDASLCSPSFFE